MSNGKRTGTSKPNKLRSRTKPKGCNSRKEVFLMRLSREKEKEQRKVKREEELNRKTEWGTKDLTPYNAVRLMKGKEIAFR